jgi:acetyl-CoA C-acetyltransferase
MHMTKHVFGVYSTVPGTIEPPQVVPGGDVVPVVAEHDGDAEVVAYSVVHGRDGDPVWALLVCDTGGARTYARLDHRDAMREAERHELVGRRVTLAPTTLSGPMGESRVNVASI